MKKWIIILLSAVLILSFSACVKNEQNQPKNDSSIQQSDSASNEEVTKQPDSISNEEIKEESDSASSKEISQQSDLTSNNEDHKQPDSASNDKNEPAKAELKYNTGYYSFEDLNDGFIDVRSLVFHDDGTVDYDWATYDYNTVGDYKLEYNGKPIYMVAGPSGDTFSYTVSDDKITVTDWNSKNTVFVLKSDGNLKIEKTASESFTAGKEYVIK